MDAIAHDKIFARYRELARLVGRLEAVLDDLFVVALANTEPDVQVQATVMTRYREARELLDAHFSGADEPPKPQ